MTDYADQLKFSSKVSSNTKKSILLDQDRLTQASKWLGPGNVQSFDLSGMDVKKQSLWRKLTLVIEASCE